MIPKPLEEGLTLSTCPLPLLFEYYLVALLTLSDSDGRELVTRLVTATTLLTECGLVVSGQP